MSKNKRKFGAIIQIGNILVSEDLIDEFFACDYQQCKGICCIEGDSGAPMEESETLSLEENYPHYKDFMNENGRKAIEDKGFFEIDRDGDIVTPLVESSCECAFCHFGSNNEALCSIEMAGRRKPISCSLYPIRVTKLTGGGLALNLHRWEICRAAFEKGAKEGIRVYEFLRKPLIQAYGEEFYEELCCAAKYLLEQSSHNSCNQN